MFLSNYFRCKKHPVHVSTKEHIEAHFLTCFFALLLIRLVEMKTEHKHSTKTLINEMKNITGTYLDENYYMLDHYIYTLSPVGLFGGNTIKHLLSNMKAKSLGAYQNRKEA